MLKTPLQVVPASSVKNDKTSTPEEVRTGADPPGQSTETGQEIEKEPPLVNSRTKILALEEDGLLNVIDVILPVTVAVTKLPEFKSIVTEPDIFPKLFSTKE